VSVSLGRSPPVLRAGVRWTKLELAWRFGSSDRVGAVRHYLAAAAAAAAAAAILS
jgi:hypothetical protein